MNLAIIQARNGSSRLPNKVSMDLCGKTVLEHVVNRVSRARNIDKVVVATTVSEADLSLVELCAKNKISVFVGSESDVLDRFYQCAKLFEPDNVIRITADCPLLDSDVVDSVISKFIQDNADYTSNCVPPTFPDGLDAEVFTFRSLEEAWNNASLKSEREHVTPYIRNNKNNKITNYENDTDLSDKRWTLDEKEDYDLICKIYDNLYVKSDYFGLHEVLTLLVDNESFELINEKFHRNEGLEKSLSEDKVVK